LLGCLPVSYHIGMTPKRGVARIIFLACSSGDARRLSGVLLFA
jgi:hypothetical protein